MKKTVLILVVLALNLATIAQSALWTLPYKQRDMVSGWIISLPTPQYYPSSTVPISWPDGYDGRAAEHSHNAMHDANGDLLFFIIDGYIFDKNGYLISDDFALAMATGDEGVDIVPFAQDCNKFHILASTRGVYSSAQPTTFAGVLDLTLFGYSSVAPQGAIVNGLQDLRNLLPYTIKSQLWSSDLNTKCRATVSAITPITNNNERYLYLNNNFAAIFRYKFTPNGLVYDNYYWQLPPSKLQGLIQSPNLNIEIRNVDDIIEMELIELNGGNYRLAFSSNLYGPLNYNGIDNRRVVVVADIDGSTYNFIDSSVDFILFDFEETYGNLGTKFFNTGLEFSKSGKFLYMSHIPSNQHPNCIEVYDVNAHSFVSNFNIGSAQDYQKSQIEMGYNGKLYVANATSLASISSPDSPQSSVLAVEDNITYPAVYPVTSGNSGIDETYLLPQQIDGEDPFARFSNTCCMEIDGGAFDFTTNTGYQVWSPGNNPFSNAVGAVHIDGYLKIPTGANVHINNMTFTFAQGAEMIIEKGARVYLNNSVLTSNACQGIMWEGVRVYGTSNATQSFANQGYLNLRNNSEISNAYIGVALHKRDANNNIDWGSTGGRITARDSRFINNKRDVIFLSYSNYNSLSDFVNCDFTTTSSPLADGSSYPNVHVSMLDVKGLSFKGCRFANTTNVADALRGDGIVSIDASYDVDFYCTATTVGTCPLNSRIFSDFSNLRYGIDANAPSSNRVVKVKYTTFNENSRACRMNTVNNYMFVNNTVKVGAAGVAPYTYPYGLYSISSTQYTIENNSFSSIHNDNSYGILMANSNNQGNAPDQNEVYHNTFEGLNVGAFNMGFNVQVNGGNPVNYTGLTYRCNDFNNSTTSDIYLTNIWNTGGIAPHQGSCVNVTAPSNNLYSIANPISSNYTNNLPIQYQLTNAIANGGPARLVPTLSNPSNTHNSFCGNVQYNPSVSCPEKRFDIVQIKPWGMFGKIATLESNSKAEKMALEKIDTETNLLWSKAVGGILPWEVFTSEIVNNYSPLVSADLLSKIIDNSNVIPQGLIKEILLSNLPLSYTIEDKVRNSALSSAVKSQILGTRVEGINARYEKESSIAYYEREIAFLNRDIKRYYLTDSTVVNGLDSLITMLEKQNNVSAQKELVVAYYTNKQYEKAKNLLLLLEEQGVDREFIAFQKLLLNQTGDKKYQIQKGTANYNAIQRLTSLVYATTTSAKANVLYEWNSNANGGNVDIHEVEPILSSTKSKSINNTLIEQNEEKDAIAIYPNPTAGIITVELLLNENENATITVLDQVGKLIKVETITNTKSYVDISDLANGIYVLKIENKGKITMKKILKK